MVFFFFFSSFGFTWNEKFFWVKESFPPLWEYHHETYIDEGWLLGMRISVVSTRPSFEPDFPPPRFMEKVQNNVTHPRCEFSHKDWSYKCTLSLAGENVVWSLYKWSNLLLYLNRCAFSCIEYARANTWAFTKQPLMLFFIRIGMFAGSVPNIDRSSSNNKGLSRNIGTKFRSPHRHLLCGVPLHSTTPDWDCPKLPGGNVGVGKPF